jgi:hypothetical protein
MHVSYTPEDFNYWLNVYKDSISAQSQYQIGGDLPGFRAFAPHHRGGGLGSFFKRLFRYSLPILKTIGKHALVTGSKIAADVAQGRSLKESAQEHARSGVSNVLNETGDNIAQSGKGLGAKRQYKRKRSKASRSFPPKKPCRKVESTLGADIFD